MATIYQAPAAGVPEIAPGPGLFSDEHIQTPYGTYEITVRYANSQGLAALPIARPVIAIGSATTTVAIVRLSAQWCKKIVNWSATRPGLQPLVPSAVSTDPNLVLLLNDYWPVAPMLMADGVTRVYGFAGMYVYACLQPVQESAGFPLSFAPWQTANTETFAGSNFQNNIIR